MGNITTSEFDSELRLKRLVTPTGESQSFTWCNCGSPASITDELGHTTKFAYDNPFRRLTGFTDAKGNTTRYTYNTKGNLLATIYPNNSAEVFGGYTPEGLPLSYTNRCSQPITYTYTPAGQISRQSFTNGNYNEFFYDLRGNLSNVTEHLAGSTNKVTTYFYDYVTAGDRLRKVIYPNARWVEFFYDTHGRRSRMTDVTGQDLRYDYDAAGRLWRLRDATNAVIVEYLYNTTGRLQRINKGNGTYTTYEYDAAGQILHLVNYAPNGSVNSRFDYTYDKRGRRTSMGTVDGDWTYDYDATGQLIRAQLASTNPQIPNQDLQYNYDALGNRTTAMSNGVTTVYVANNLNQYTSVGGVAYQYDADGNLTFDGIRNLEYDVRSRLVRVTGPEGVTEYEYNAAGSRTATVFNGQRTEYLLDPSGLVNVIAEHEGGGILLARNVHGLGLVGRTLGISGLYFMDFDALGSTAAMTGSSGAVVNRYAYQPCGSLILNTEAVANPFRFVGQHGVTHEPNHLHSMRMRYYSIDIGRFASIDPIRLSGGDVNLYGYANNDFTSLIDPNGLEWWTISTDGLIQAFVSTATVVATVAVAAAVVVIIAPAVTATVAATVVAVTVTLSHPALVPVYNFMADYARAGRFYGQPSLGGLVTSLVKGAKGLLENSGGGGGGVPGGGGGTLGDVQQVEVSASSDPNEKFGAKGVGTQNWVTTDAVIPYRINFENLSSATAPAQEVVITDQLNTNLNWQSFQLTELGFGDVMIPVPPGLQYYETTVQMTCCGDPFEAQIEAGLNIASGELRVVFRSINPASSLPPPVSVGFLPPEDGTGRGQGHVSYLINAKTNLPTGAQIRNVALITFDRQQSIATDQIDPLNPGAGIDPNKQALNTIDAVAPSSSVAVLPTESGRAINVQWSGQDDTGGSGIASYDVFVSTNGGPFATWFQHTTNTSAWFAGQAAQAYSFYSVARDQVGNFELPPMTPDAFTQVVTNAPKIIAVDGQQLDVGAGLVISNGVVGASASGFLWGLAGGVPSGVSITSSNGVLRWTPGCSQGNTTNSIVVLATDRTRTNISDLAVITLAVKECVAPTLGRLVLRAGDTGRLPINLITSVPLTNLITLVSVPTNRFINLGVEALATQICFATITATNAFLLPGGGGSSEDEGYLIALTTCSNQSLVGTQQVAWLVLTAVTNRPSAFVPVEVGPSIGTQPDGTLSTNYVTQSGTVVVVGEEPLLESTRSTNGLVQLILYSKTGVTNRVQSSATLQMIGPWTEWEQIVPSNILQNLTPLPPTNHLMIFRAVRP